MKPMRAFFLSFAAGLLTLFSGNFAYTDLLTPAPDVQVGPIDPERLTSA